MPLEPSRTLVAQTVETLQHLASQRSVAVAVVGTTQTQVLLVVQVVAVALRNLQLELLLLVVQELLVKEMPVELHASTTLTATLLAGTQALVVAVALVASAETQYKSLLVTGLTVV